MLGHFCVILKRRSYTLLSLFLAILLLLGFQTGARASFTITSVAAGEQPSAVAVNPVTNQIYIANQVDGSVTVINGATNHTETIRLETASSLCAIAVNPATNKIYVVDNSNPGKVFVIDGNTKQVQNIALPAGPTAIAINSVYNKIYIANHASDSVTVIDGTSNQTETINVGSQPCAVAVNPFTNKVYVANSGGNTLTVIDILTNEIQDITVGSNPTVMAINPAKNKIYLGFNSGTSIAVVDGFNNKVETIETGPITPTGAAVNPVTNSIYFISSSPNCVLAINDPDYRVTTISTTGKADAIAINPMTNKIYAISSNTGDMTIIDGTTNSSMGWKINYYPKAIGINPITDRLYIANSLSNNVTIIDETDINTDTAHEIPAGNVNVTKGSVAFNPFNNDFYVADYLSNTIMIIDSLTGTYSTLPVGDRPSAVVVNPFNNQVYIANCNSNTVTVIDGATRTVQDTVNVGSAPIALAVNPVTNQVYVLNSVSKDITVIDGATHDTTVIQLLSSNSPTAFSINPITNRIYVANSQDNNVTVINGTTQEIIATVSTGANSHPIAIAVNPITNKIYTANNSDSNRTVSAIHGDTNTVHNISIWMKATAIEVNTVTNKIYGANPDFGIISIIDGTTETTDDTDGLYASRNQPGIAVDSAANRVFFTNCDGTILVLDGITNSLITIGNHNVRYPLGVAVNPANGKVCIANGVDGSPGVTIFDSQRLQDTPLTPCIQATDSRTKISFSFTSSSTFSPCMITAQHLYYQVDAITGKWDSAPMANGSFIGTIPELSPGMHVLYVFAIDGQETKACNGSGIFTSKIASFFFIVPSAPDMSRDTDRGSRNNDKITCSNQPTFTGKTMPNSTVNIYIDDQVTSIDAIVTNPTGEWSWTPTFTLSEGTHTIQMLVTEPQLLRVPSAPLKFAIDQTAPTILGAERIDNTHIKVTLSESCTGLSASGNGGFTVRETGSLSDYQVTSINQGNTDRIVILTVEDMSYSGAVGVTVKYFAGENCLVQDIAGNLMQTNGTGSIIPGWIPNIGIDSVSATEGSTAVFTVTLSKAYSDPVSVSYSIVGITALTGSDIDNKSDNLIFTPGETTKTINIPVKDDSLDEDDETFSVRLSSVINAVIAVPQGTGTIIDNDPAPSMSINDATVTEGDTGSANAVFTVTLSTASGKTVTVEYATAAGTATADDYTATSGTLTFAPGVTSQTISVPVLGDLNHEGNEAFNINLSNAVNTSITDGQGTGWIMDNEKPGLSIHDVSVTEGDSGPVYATLTVTLLPASPKTVTVKYTTAAGTAKADADYVSKTGTLTFAPGVTSKTITVAVKGDLTYEADETFTVNLSSPVNALIVDKQGIATITNNDPQPTIKVSDATVTEGTTTINAVFTVSLSAACGKTVSVKYATTAGSAIEGVDYTGKTGTLTFAPGIKALTVSVPVKADPLDEDNETFNLNLSEAVEATIADGEGLGTIKDNDATPGLTINDVTVTEGDDASVNAVFTVKLSAVSGRTATVNYTISDGTAVTGADYTASSGTLTFAPGIVTQTITVPVQGDLAQEGSEIFKVNLSGAANATIVDGQGVATILDNESPLLIIDDVTVTEGDSGSVNAIFTVSLLPASQKTVTVKYATAAGTAKADVDYLSKTGTLTFAPGQTSKTVTIAVKGDLTHEADETFSVNLSSAVNAPISDKQGIGTITNNDPQPTIKINDVTVTEGNSGSVNAIFTVSLSAACGKTVTMEYVTADGTATAGQDYTRKTGTLTFTPGVKSLTVSVPVKADLLDEVNETFNINLGEAVNATIFDGVGLGTIKDDDATPSLSINDVTIAEGDAGVPNAVFTVKLSTISGRTVTVNYTTAAGTAAADKDYTTTSGTLTFNPGVRELTIPVPVNDDPTDEDKETFKVSLSNAVNAGILDGTGVCTITDNDPAPYLHINNVSTHERKDDYSMGFTVSLSAASERTVTVHYSTSPGTAKSGTDFVAVSSTLQFSPGVTALPVLVTIKGDTVAEPDETFMLNLSGATNAVIAEQFGTCTIIDYDGTN